MAGAPRVLRPAERCSPLMRCLIFDVDDTLYLERDYVRSGFAAVGDLRRARARHRRPEPACWTLFESGARGDTFDRALTTLGLAADVALTAELIDIYRAHAPHILFSPTRARASSAGAASVHRSRHRRPAGQPARQDRALGLDEYVDRAVVTSELGDAASPTRAPSLCSRTTGLADADCAYVADNPAKDFGGPRSLGWRTERIRRVDGQPPRHRAAPTSTARSPRSTSSTMLQPARRAEEAAEIARR